MAISGFKRFKNEDGEEVTCYWSVEPIYGSFPDCEFIVEAQLTKNLGYYRGGGGTAAFTIAGTPNATRQSFNSPPMVRMTVPLSFPNGYLLDASLNVSGALNYWQSDDSPRRTVNFLISDLIDLTPWATGTVIQAEGLYLDEPLRIRLASMSPEYTNTMTYTYGTQSGTIATKTAATLVNWTPPASTINGLSSTATEAPLTITTRAYDGSTIVGNSTTYTINLAANPDTQGPVFNPVMTDTNSTTRALTGSATTIVAEKSTMRVATGVTGRGAATITDTRVSTNDDFLTGQTVTLSKPSPLVTLYAIDTRNFVTEKIYTPVSYIEYFEPSAITDTTMSAAGVLTSNITGRFFNGNFGAVSNTITARFRWQQPGESTWSAWSNVALTVNNEMITGTATVSGLNYRQRYYMEIEITDKLATVLIETSSLGTPVFDWSKTDFNFNVPVNFTAGATGASSAAIFTCNTVSTTAAKVLVGNNDLSVQEGTSIYVAFNYINQVNNVTFRIGVTTYPATSLNGSLIKAWAENSLVEFVYMGNTFVLVTRGDTQDAPSPVGDREVVLRSSVLTGGNSFSPATYFRDYDRLRIYADLGGRRAICEVDTSRRSSSPVTGGLYLPTPDLVTSSSSSSITGYAMQFSINTVTNNFTLSKILKMTPLGSTDVTNSAYYAIYRVVGIKP